MPEDRVSRAVSLGVAALAWTVWCLFSVAPVSLIVRLASTLLRSPALAEEAMPGVLVEMLLLAVTAFVVFRLLIRFDPPERFWVVAPAGYAASFAGYLAIARLGGETLGVSPAALVEVAAVCAVVSAGAYLGSARRSSAESIADAGRTTG